jgi:hypothetical protein
MTKFEQILYTALIIAIALFVLIGSIIITPLVLVALLGYLGFLWCKTLIK